MLKSSGAMAVATIGSRVLGLVREQVYAAFMGTSAVAGAFQMALVVPSLFRRLLGEGALTAAFIPIFKAKEVNEGEKAMWRAANAVISGLIVSTTLLCAAIIIGLTLFLSQATLEANTRLMLELLRIMVPYMLLVCLAAVFMGMLNARGRFFVPALGAASLNVVMIASVLFLAPRMGDTLEKQVFALAIGIVVAGVAQAGFQIPFLRRGGFRFAWVSPWRNETVREVVRKMVPASVGVAAFQINVLVTMAIAFVVHPPIVATFNYAVRLMEFPQGVFGISLATFILPTLSGLAAEKRHDEFRATLAQAMGYLWFVNLMAAVFLAVLAKPMVRLLFQWGAFTPKSTHDVSLALVALALGLVAFSTVNILARAFYALGDTRTPMRISVFCLSLNVLLTALLVVPLGAGGLALANAATSWINLGLLTFALRKKLGKLEFGALRSGMMIIVPSALAAGLTAWFLNQTWERTIGFSSLGERLGAVFLPIVAAGSVYVGFCLWAKLPAAVDFFNLVRRK